MQIFNIFFCWSTLKLPEIKFCPNGWLVLIAITAHEGIVKNAVYIPGYTQIMSKSLILNTKSMV